MCRQSLRSFTVSPVASTLARTNPEALAQLRRDLAVVMSAEALFTLTDLCQLPAGDAIASAVHTARALTAAAICAGSAPGS